MLRRKWNNAYPSLVTKAIHLALFLTIAEIIVVLHADELSPAVLLGDKLKLGELGCIHGARTNVANFTALDEIVESPHGFFSGDGRVITVDLEEVDVIGV